MTPYYEDDFATIYHGDCREVLAWLEADVLVTDPPYGMAFVSSMARAGRGKYRRPADPTPVVGDGDSAARDQVLAMWGTDRPALVFGSWRVERPAGTRQLIVWVKGASPGLGDLSIPWGPGHEEVYVLGDGFIGPRRPNVITIDGLMSQDASRPDHPTPKPTGVMVDLLRHCPPGVVADPFMGSGTTLRAAKDLGRRCIGIEIEERYCEIAAKRLAQEVLDFGGVA